MFTAPFLILAAIVARERINVVPFHCSNAAVIPTDKTRSLTNCFLPLSERKVSH